MSNFWTSGSGTTITGRPEDSFIKDFSIIPDGTTALAKIKEFIIVEKTTQYAGEQKFMQITYKLTSGEFKDREVTQKIKPFDGTPQSIDRNLNMLKLVMELCDFNASHDVEPTSQDLMLMNGKILGIKIKEWSMPKTDGSGIMEGNFVGEVWPAAGFESETGIKAEHVHSMPSDSALSRNAKSRSEPDFEDSLPF